MSRIIWETLVISNILYIHPLYKYVFSLHYSLKLLPNSLILPLKIFQIFGDYFWICSRLLKKSLQENFSFLYSKGQSHIEKNVWWIVLELSEPEISVLAENWRTLMVRFMKEKLVLTLIIESLFQK